MAETRKDLTYYRSLAYAREILPSREGGFVASYPDLPGCAVQGEDLAETMATLDDGRDLWLQARIDDGEPIPEPPSAEPSGRLMLRVPIRLHARLDELATAYEKSLNRMLNELLFNHANALPPWHGLGEPTRSERDDSRCAYWLTPEPDGGFVAEHPDLPGCVAVGDTPAEAMAELDKARALWLEARKEQGLPEAAALSSVHNGAIHLRMPPALHADLARDAQRNGASLNQLLTVVLAEAVAELRTRVSAGGRARNVPAWNPGLVEMTVGLLRSNPDRKAIDLPQGLAERATHFLRAIVYFERASAARDHKDFSSAFECLRAATIEGLDFETEALELFELMPRRLGELTLSNQALQLLHSYSEPPPKEDHAMSLADVEYEFRRRVKCNLMQFVEGVRKEPIRQKGWEALAA